MLVFVERNGGVSMIPFILILQEYSCSKKIGNSWLIKSMIIFEGYFTMQSIFHVAFSLHNNSISRHYYLHFRDKKTEMTYMTLVITFSTKWLSLWIPQLFFSLLCISCLPNITIGSRNVKFMSWNIHVNFMFFRVWLRTKVTK